MLEKGITVNYIAHGICRIKDIREEKFFGELKKYYILEPLNDKNSTYFIPADNKDLVCQLQKIISPVQICEIIKNLPDENPEWICDNRKRTETFKSIINSGDRRKLIILTKVLYNRKKFLEQSGKRISSTDDMILKKAEKMLFEEFALSLHINADEVVDFITEKINENALQEK